MPTSPMNANPVLARGNAPGESWIRRMVRRAGIVIATVACPVLAVPVVVRIATAGPEETTVHGLLTSADHGNYSAARRQRDSGIGSRGAGDRQTGQGQRKMGRAFHRRHAGKEDLLQGGEVTAGVRAGICCWPATDGAGC
jgi:hypothetical protein